MTRATLIALSLFVAAIGSVVAIPIHASSAKAARDRENKAIREIAPRLPAGDLALSGGARWLRFPSLEEPHAAFADAPAAPDPDPAGGMMAPPRDLYEASGAQPRSPWGSGEPRQGRAR